MGQFFPVHYLDILPMLIRSAAKFYLDQQKKIENEKKLELLCEKKIEFFDIFENVRNFHDFTVGLPLANFRKK